MTELWLTGTLVQETTKCDKDGQRETVFQVRTGLGPDACAELALLIGRQCWMHIEDTITHGARSCLRAGQLSMDLEAPADGDREMEPPALCLCGHTGQQHVGEQGCCTGDDGMCTCTAFEQALSRDATSGEHAEGTEMADQALLEEMPPTHTEEL